MSDKKGMFRFDNLQMGKYTVSASKRNIPTGVRNVRRTVTAQKEVEINGYTQEVKGVRLLLQNDRLLTVKGRVVNEGGEGVPDIRIEATDWTDGWTEGPLNADTVTDCEGYYAFTELNPANYFHLFGLLAAGKKGSGFGLVNITVIAKNDFPYKATESIQVSRVTTEQLAPARRMLKIYSDMDKRSGGKGVIEVEGISFSKFQDNVIFAPDIVLKKNDSAE